MVKAGKKRVTAADVGRSLGLSRATVGFVLNNTPGQSIPEATRARVLAEAERLGYRPHVAAQNLASGRSSIVLLILPDWPMGFSMRLSIEEASRVLEAAGFTLITQTLHGTSMVRPLWEKFEPDVVMGMLPFSAKDVESIRSHGVNTIVPDPDSPESWEQSAGVVSGPGLQVAHLKELGHERLGFAAVADERLKPLVDARIAAAQLEAENLDLPPLVVSTVSMDSQSAQQSLKDWKAAGVTAVVAYNDEAAAVVAGAAIRSGVAVPEELAIVGHDNSPLAALFVPSLSSVRQDDEGFGRQIAQAAIRAAEGNEGPPVEQPELTTAVERREST